MYEEALEKFNEYILLKSNNETIYINYRTPDNFPIKLEKYVFKPHISIANSTDRYTVSVQVHSNSLESYDSDADSFDHINLYFDRIYYDPKKDNIGKLVYENIKNLKFDKYNGSYNIEEKTLLNIEMELFPDFFKDRICSVCYEHTNTQTNCGHRLCYICWEHILSKGNHLCPLCRECIRFVNHECFFDDCKCRN